MSIGAIHRPSATTVCQRHRRFNNKCSCINLVWRVTSSLLGSTIINIFTLTIDQMTECKMKGVSHSNEPIHFFPVLGWASLPPSELLQLKQMILPTSVAGKQRLISLLLISLRSRWRLHRAGKESEHREFSKHNPKWMLTPPLVPHRSHVYDCSDMSHIEPRGITRSNHPHVPHGPPLHEFRMCRCWV